MQFLDVHDFQAAMGLPMPMVLQKMPNDLCQFRRKFLEEELDEYMDASNKLDLVKQVDSLIDLNYVIYGTMLFMGATSSKYDQLTDYAVFAGESPRPRDLQYKPTANAYYPPMAFKIEAQQAIDEFIALHFHGVLARAVNRLVHLAYLSHQQMLSHDINGTLYTAIWNLVHSANMKKRRALNDADSKRGCGQYDVVKPEGWQSPEPAIAELLGVKPS